MIAALTYVARYQHYTVKEFDWYFYIAPSCTEVFEKMEELVPEVEEYLRNHNGERFGFCPTFNSNIPIKEELRDLYIDNIDTYKKVLKFARDMLIDDSERAVLRERGQTACHISISITRLINSDREDEGESE